MLATTWERVPEEAPAEQEIVPEDQRFRRVQLAVAAESGFWSAVETLTYALSKVTT